MEIYIILTIVTVGMAFFVNNRVPVSVGGPNKQQMSNRVIIAAMFLLLFAVSACRIAIGNDYWEYTRIFYLISEGRYVSTEWGFNLVVRIMQFLFGTSKYIPIFALFAALTVGFLLKALYDQSENFVFSFFLLMTAGYYLSSMNSIRYYFALAIAVYAMKYAIEHDYTRLVLWVLPAACIHKSILVVIPLYFIASIKWKKWHLIVVGVICTTFLVFQNVYRQIIFTFYPYYENSMFDTGETSTINILRCAGVLLLSILYYKTAIRDDKSNTFYFNLNLGALILYTFCSFIPEISRIGYYLNISHIFLIPGIIRVISDKKRKYFFEALIVLAFIAYFGIFLVKAEDVSVRLVPYMNWIFD